MNVKTENQENMVIIEIMDLERLNTTSSAELRTTLLEEINKKNNVIIDMAGIKYIDSAGLSVFISIQKMMNENKGTLKLSGMSPTVMSMFELTRLHRVFDIFPDKAAAISAMDID
jgi:anti-sigma B factor antagonist